MNPMRDPPGQEELELWPLPKWPTLTYVREAFQIYLLVSLAAGLLSVVAIIAIRQPLWAAIFVAGGVAGAVAVTLARRWLPKVLRRLSRIMAFPHHA
jgi:hypothetical protein